jgi:glycerophosphoryl diester phosphodiesterase
MKIIAHRGNLDGKNPSRENSPEYIDEAIEAGFDVEIDVRCEDHQFYLGHDDAQYHVPMTWLVKRKDKLWIHCKDLKSLDVLSSSPVDFHYFWHDIDRYTLTSKGIGWVLIGQFPFKKSIIVLPESINYYDKYEEKYDRILETMGICTDKCNFYKKELMENQNEMDN